MLAKEQELDPRDSTTPRDWSGLEGGQARQCTGAKESLQQHRTCISRHWQGSRRKLVVI